MIFILEVLFSNLAEIFGSELVFYVFAPSFPFL
jgi:hypothetical protein